MPLKIVLLKYPGKRNFLKGDICIMEQILTKIARWIVTYRWVVMSLWVIVLVFGGYYATQVGERLTGGGWAVPGSDSCCLHYR